MATRFRLSFGSIRSTSRRVRKGSTAVEMALVAPVFFLLLMGMTAWILRYVCFAYGGLGANAWMLYAGIILHGVCYDFFFVTGYMYTEKKAGERIKNAAQQLFTFATYGLGMFIGTYFSGFIDDKYAIGPNVHDWKHIWLVPAYIAAGVLCNSRKGSAVCSARV